LTGPPQALQPVWQGYSVAAEVGVAPQQASHEAHTAGRVIHTAGVYLIDQQGRERWYFSVEADASTIEPMSRLIAQRLQALAREG
jgi:cytochrome oxidase Cu insertion factor (SCO1/SenC/PrrC family)